MAEKEQQPDNTGNYAVNDLASIIGNQAKMIGRLTQQNDELRSSLASANALIKELQKGDPTNGTESADTEHQ